MITVPGVIGGIKYLISINMNLATINYRKEKASSRGSSVSSSAPYEAWSILGSASTLVLLDGVLFSQFLCRCFLVWIFNVYYCIACCEVYFVYGYRSSLSIQICIGHNVQHAHLRCDWIFFCCCYNLAITYTSFKKVII